VDRHGPALHARSVSRTLVTCCDNHIRHLRPSSQLHRFDSLQVFKLETSGVAWHGLKQGIDAQACASERSLPLLLIHGTAGSSHCWRPVLEELGAGISVLVPDLPGHGRTVCTRHRRHGIEEMAADLAALLAELGYARVGVVAGHSAGAAIALELARAGASQSRDASANRAQGPSPPALEIGVILGIAPSLVPPPAFYTLMLGPLLAPIVGSAASIAAAALLTRTTRTADRLLDSTGSVIAESQRAVYRELLSSRTHLQGAVDFMTATRLPDLLPRLSGLRGPAHFLIGEDDPWIPVRPLREVIERYMPAARIESCRGGHLLPESQPARVAASLKALLGEGAD
jgi:magnesium chelatase accessory protein